MSLLEVTYGGQAYQVADRDAASLRREVEQILDSGRPGWISVRDGSPLPVELLIQPGVTLAIVPLPEA